MLFLCEKSSLPELTGEMFSMSFLSIHAPWEIFVQRWCNQYCDFKSFSMAGHFNVLNYRIGPVQEDMITRSKDKWWFVVVFENSCSPNISRTLKKVHVDSYFVKNVKVKTANHGWLIAKPAKKNKTAVLFLLDILFDFAGANLFTGFCGQIFKCIKYRTFVELLLDVL